MNNRSRRQTRAWCRAAMIYDELAGIRRAARMKDAKPHPIELTTSMVEFLQNAAAQHGLPDIGKAVRCLVNYAREHPGRSQEIFGDIRCLDC